MNPWRISPREGETLDAVLVHAEDALAAKALGVSIKTLRASITRSRAKMGNVKRLHALVMWRDWRQAKPAA
jgi:DNA-binding CsgD family transcriptional regulator